MIRASIELLVENPFLGVDFEAMPLCVAHALGHFDANLIRQLYQRQSPVCVWRWRTSTDHLGITKQFDSPLNWKYGQVAICVVEDEWWFKQG